jgi:hypothetical protein
MGAVLVTAQTSFFQDYPEPGFSHPAIRAAPFGEVRRAGRLSPSGRIG